MRCDCCPLCDPEEPCCPEAEGEYGITHKDGVCGCRHPWNWIYKRYMMHTDEIGEVGLDMGIKMSFTPEELQAVIATCRHMIGIDFGGMYRRCGKIFYKPIRNYLEAGMLGVKLLDKLPKCVMVSKRVQGSIMYSLTPTGLAWLGRRIGVVIREVE